MKTIKPILFCLLIINNIFANGSQNQPIVVTASTSGNYNQFSTYGSEIWLSFLTNSGKNFFDVYFVPDTINFNYSVTLFNQNGANLDTVVKDNCSRGKIFFPLVNSNSGQNFKVIIQKQLKSTCTNCNLNSNLNIYYRLFVPEPTSGCNNNCENAYSLNRNNFITNPSFEAEPNYLPLCNANNNSEQDLSNLNRALAQNWYSCRDILKWYGWDQVTPDILRANYHNLNNCFGPAAYFNLNNINAIHGNFVLGCLYDRRQSTGMSPYAEKALTPTCYDLVAGTTYEITFNVRRANAFGNINPSKVGYSLFYHPTGSTYPINYYVSNTIMPTYEVDINNYNWQKITHFYTPTQTGQYILALGFFNQNQGVDREYVYFDGIEIRPKTTPTITASSSNFCGDPVTLTANIPAGGTNFYWSVNGQVISTNTTITVSPTTTTTYTANYTGQGFYCSNYETYTITHVSELPLNITANAPYVCGNTPVYLTLNGAPAGATFRWSFNGNIIIGASSTYSSYPATQAGTYTCRVTYGNSPNQCERIVSYTLLTDQFYCCDNSTTYSKNTFTASGTTTQTWTPTNNPLNNNGGNYATVKNDLIIPPGYQIVIKDMTIGFGPNGRVVVQNSTGTSIGARLTLDNSRLRSGGTSCDLYHMWNGLEVKGSETAIQGTFSNSKQGWLRITNNSSIEDAWFGVNLSANVNAKAPTNEEDYLWTYNDNPVGGVVEASNCQFLNNRKDVHFGPYQNKNAQGAIINNVSKFTNVKFRTTSALKIRANNPNGQGTIHANLSGVRGIDFTACDFINTYHNSLAIDKRGTGIMANNSIFNVNKTGQDSGRFVNLNYGISAFTSGSTLYPFMVRTSTFINNKIATKAENISNLAFVQNTVKIYNETDASASNPAIGLSLIGCTGYSVEENIFTNTTGTTAYNTYGILVDNSGNADNQIYRNNFSYLKRGIHAQYINGYINNSSTGLRLLCNTNLSNTITEFAELNATSVSTLAKDQGNTIVPAGNSFFGTNANSNYSDFRNNNLSPIFYYRHNDADRTIQNPINVNQVNTGIAYTTSTCPSNYITGGGQKTVSDISKLAALEKSAGKGNIKHDLFNSTERKLSPEQINANLERTRLLNNIIRNYLTGDVPNPMDSVLSLMTVRADLFGPEALANAYLANDDTTEALNNLDNAPLSTEEQNLYNLLLSLHNNTATLTDSSFVNHLQGLLNSSDYGVMRQANLLNQVATGNDLFPYLEGDESINKRFNNLNDINETNSGTFSISGGKQIIYPNPAKDIVFIEGFNGEFAIYTLNGKLIANGIVNNNTGIDVSSFNNGVYFIKIKNTENETTQTLKLNVLH